MLDYSCECLSVLGAAVNKFVLKNQNDCPYATVASACFNSHYCTYEGGIFTQYLTSEYKFLSSVSLS